jgi:type I restriction enzyme S subunit
MAVVSENKRKNVGLAEDQVLSLSFGKVVVKPVEKQRGLVPESYEGYQVLDPGDIVIRPTDLQNDQRSIRVGMVRDRGIITSAYIGLQARQPWSTDYAYAYLATVDSTKRIYGMGSGLRQQLGWVDLKRMPCLVPPAEEQAAIVKYLAHASARIDKAIAAKRRLIALLGEQRVALLEDLIRTVGGLWPARRLKTLLTSIDQGVSPQADNAIPAADEWGVLKSGCVNYGSFRPDQVKKLPSDFDVPTRYAIGEGDILVSRASGSPDLVGSVARVPAEHPRAILSDKIFRLHLRKDVDPEFLVLQMNGRAYREQVRAAISGAEGLANNLPVTALRAVTFRLPPLGEQVEIVRVINRETEVLAATVVRLEREIQLLREFRTRLVADVVTGQVDVRGIAAGLPGVDPAAAWSSGELDPESADLAVSEDELTESEA